MNEDIGKIVASALLATASSVVALWLPVQGIIRAHMRYFVSGPLDFMHPEGLSTMGGFVILVAGLFLIFLVPLILLWRTVTMRRAGLVLKRAHGEAQRGMPGLEGLRERMR